MSIDPTEEAPTLENDDLQEELIITIDKKQSPVRIDSFLTEKIKNVSRTRIQNGLRAGSITVDGKAVKPNYKVMPLNAIKVILPHHENYDIVAEDIPLDIIYEDEDLLVVNKPSGMVVHPAIGNPRGTLLNALSFYLDFSPDSSTKSSPNFERLGLVHRIDKETSGLLVIAKNEYALSHLARHFYDHTTSREYVALVWGSPEDDAGSVDLPIGRHPRHRQLYTTFPERDAGKHAVTHWELMERMYYVSLIKCKLETGRTHQIRVHMQSLGHPVFNDERYGGNRIVKGTVYSKYKQFVDNVFAGFPRHALHARTLGFVHPTTGKALSFDSPLPAEMEEVVQKWRHYVEHQKQLKT
ncbi:MAG: RluA family pseudouridine synthase [Saprospiraceae bacterium]|nr:RluA family pseudouridine synthase [Saprospiraceae bacterium]